MVQCYDIQKLLLLCGRNDLSIAHDDVKKMKNYEDSLFSEKCIK